MCCEAPVGSDNRTAAGEVENLDLLWHLEKGEL